MTMIENRPAPSGAAGAVAPAVPPGAYTRIFSAAGNATVAAAAGSKYVLRGGGDATTIQVGQQAVCYHWLRGADFTAPVGLTLKFRLVTVIKSGTTGPAITVAISLYTVTQANNDSLNAAVGSPVSVVNPTAAGDTLTDSGDFDPPADGLIAIGYTVSGTPAGPFSVQGWLERRYV